jgi:hypothetical protein
MLLGLIVYALEWTTFFQLGEYRRKDGVIFLLIYDYSRLQASILSIRRFPCGKFVHVQVVQLKEEKKKGQGEDGSPFSTSNPPRAQFSKGRPSKT